MPTTTFSPTGTATVDGLLSGAKYAADADGVTQVTFSIPKEGAVFEGYPAGEEPDTGFAPVSAAVEQSLRNAIANVESFTNLKFTEVTENGSNVGDLRIAMTDFVLEGSAAWTIVPDDSHHGSSDIWLNAAESTDETYLVGTVIHEFGHAIGLKHPFEEEGDFPKLSSTLDGYDQTIMSYSPSTKFPDAQEADLNPSTFMYYDILALQEMYGVDKVTTAGDDTYSYKLSDRHNLTIWDYDGTDTLAVSDGDTATHLNLTPGSWSNVGTTITYDMKDGSQKTDKYTVFITPETTIENATGAGGDDTIEGNDAANTLKGMDGADSISGGEGNDTIWAGAGDTGADVMSGDAGDDMIGGGAGADTVSGGTGSDTLFGGAGNDQLNGQTATDKGDTAADAIWAGAGSDTINGAAGNDALGGGNDNDTIHAGGGNDKIYGGKSGDDVLNGEAGNDTLFGGNGNDLLSGGAGNDTIYNGGGADTVTGDDGNDVLWGGGGDDTFTGGTGDDTFAFALGNGHDTVTDFDTGADTLLLSKLGITDLSTLKEASSEVSGGLEITVNDDMTISLTGLSLADLDTMQITFE